MGYDLTTPSVGGDTKLNEFIRLRDAIQAVSAAGAHDFGGDWLSGVINVAFVDLPGSCELEIDGTNLTGLSVYLEVNAFAGVGNAAAGSPQFRLFNVTLGGAVASSTITVTSVSPGARKRGASGAITLNTALNTYKVQILSDSGIRSFSGCARLTIRG